MSLLIYGAKSTVPIDEVFIIKYMNYFGGAIEKTPTPNSSHRFFSSVIFHFSSQSALLLMCLNTALTPASLIQTLQSFIFTAHFLTALNTGFNPNPHHSNPFGHSLLHFLSKAVLYPSSNTMNTSKQKGSNKAPSKPPVNSKQRASKKPPSNPPVNSKQKRSKNPPSNPTVPLKRRIRLRLKIPTFGQLVVRYFQPPAKNPAKPPPPQKHKHQHPPADLPPHLRPCYQNGVWGPSTYQSPKWAPLKQPADCLVWPVLPPPNYMARSTRPWMQMGHFMEVCSPCYALPLPIGNFINWPRTTRYLAFDTHEQSTEKGQSSKSSHLGLGFS